MTVSMFAFQIQLTVPVKRERKSTFLKILAKESFSAFDFNTFQRFFSIFKPAHLRPLVAAVSVHKRSLFPLSKNG